MIAVTRLEIKDNILIVCAYQFVEEVDFDYFKSGGHLYKLNFRGIPDYVLEAIIQEMIQDGHVEDHEGKYSLTSAGHDLNDSGGYVTLSSKPKPWWRFLF